MGNYTNYFNRIGYKPKYFCGDRIYGRWNNIPFIGTVGSDLVVDETGPRLTVLLDLPLQYEGIIHRVIFTKHSNVCPLKNFD